MGEAPDRLRRSPQMRLETLPLPLQWSRALPPSATAFSRRKPASNLLHNAAAGACCLAVLLGLGGGQAAGALALPLRAAGLAAMHQDGALIAAADSALTLSVKDIDAEPGIDAPITIKLPSIAELRAAGAEEGTYLLIRGLPDGVNVSAGMAAGRVWVVPLREAAALRLISKPGMSAQVQLKFHLIGWNNRLLAETATALNLRPIQAVAALAPLQPEAARPQPQAQPEPQPLPQALPQPQPRPQPLTLREEAVLLARGKDVMQQGGIAAARLIFQALATRGSADGALALAQSYDPAFVARSASAPEPNLAEARKWYERAAELGNTDAKRRLTEIASGG